MFHTTLKNAETATVLAVVATLIVGVFLDDHRTTVAVFFSSFLTAWAATGCGVKR